MDCGKKLCMVQNALWARTVTHAFLKMWYSMLFEPNMSRSQPKNYQTKTLRTSRETERKLLTAQEPHAGGHITSDLRDCSLTGSESDFPDFLRCYYSLVERLDPLLIEDEAWRPPECWKARSMFPDRLIKLVLGARRMRMVPYRSVSSGPCMREGLLDEKRHRKWSQRWHCRSCGRSRCCCNCHCCCLGCWQSCSYSSLGPSCFGFP